MEKYIGIGFFERYLTVWVTLCIVAGIAIGQCVYTCGYPDLVNDLPHDAESRFSEY